MLCYHKTYTVNSSVSSHFIKNNEPRFLFLIWIVRGTSLDSIAEALGSYRNLRNVKNSALFFKF